MLLFDYDGVIVDSLEHNLSITNQACRLHAPGARTATITDLKLLSSMSFQELAEVIGVKTSEIDACLMEINRLLAIPNKNSKLFPSMATVIRELAATSRLTIVSHNTEAAINHVMEMHGLREYFCHIFGHETPGGKAEQITWLLQKYQLDGRRCYMIGDSVSDITAAKEAGVNAVAVAWGFQPIEQLRESKPDFIIERPEQLLSLIPTTAEKSC